mgnify:CR=1 FL=1
MNLDWIIEALNISIHALLAESDICDNTYTLGITDISIHALLAESDQPAQLGGQYDGLISIHALLAESDRRPKTATKTP